MLTCNVKLSGRTPLLFHFDNINFRPILKEWQTNPKNKALSVAGDDRSPAWTWLGNVYHDQGFICIPSDNLMTMLREGGAKVPTGKKGGSFKRQTQSGLLVNEAAWPLVVGGKKIEWKPFAELGTELDFAVHQKAATAAGFDLFVKTVRIGRSKHIRVRPRFDQWEASGSITILDDSITPEVLQTIMDCAGRLCGLCDWRPSSPGAPGSFGQFEATITLAK